MHMAVITVAIITSWLLLHRGFYSCGYYAVAIITVAIIACFAFTVPETGNSGEENE